MWRRIAAKDPSFGRPDVFCTHDKNEAGNHHLHRLDARIPKYIEKIAKRDPFSGKGGDRRDCHRQGDSSWLLSWTVNQRTSRSSPRTQVVIWLCMAVRGRAGDYVRSRCRTAPAVITRNGYHMGVPVEDIAGTATGITHRAGDAVHHRLLRCASSRSP
ncbi:oleate hydratase [Enterobacter kobei]|uniref:oleate hydratase n=1 Tax=Enterobacter kobei TaxID=208224 RepID=UPI003CFDF05B